LGNLAHLQICLHKQALILMASGEMKGALALLKESERLCRQLGDSAELAVLLANQAGLLSVNLSRHAEALPLAGEACRLADEHGLALRRQFGQLRDQIAQHFAKPRPVGGFASCPHPAADPDRAVRLNLEYQANRKRWDALSWWQRLRTKRPEPPAGI
jgi:tetratricopeptide (TPR) repeat protein